MVALTSDVPALAVPASVTVPSAGSSTTFSASASPVLTDQTATIKASLNGASQNSTLSLVAPAFWLRAETSELAGLNNGSAITPAKAPAGVAGNLVVNGSGSAQFSPAQAGNGVFFQNCCSNSNNAYYKFAGSGLGSIFNLSQGQITFYLKSRYSFAQRQASASAYRYAFDVRDGKGHLFTFLTQIVSGSLEFEYAMGGVLQYYFVPTGTEDSLFGAGITLKVTMMWNGNVSNLYLNDKLVKSSPYTAPASNWTTGSNFNVGAYEYLTYGGYNASDDVIDEFVVTNPSPSTPPAPVPSPATLTAVACAATALGPGGSSTCTALLSGPAATPSSIALTSNTAGLTVPASVSIPAGASSGTFSAQASAFSVDQTATITGSFGGVSKAATLSLVAQATLSGIQCSTASLTSNATATCTITLSKAAPAGVATVSLASSASHWPFRLRRQWPPARRPPPAPHPQVANGGSDCHGNGLTNGVSKTATISLTGGGSVTVTGIQCAANNLGANTGTTCTVTLSKAAPAGGTVVALTSDVPALAVPASVTVPAAGSSTTFSASASPVLTDQTATIKASLNGASQNRTVTLVAPAFWLRAEASELAGPNNGSAIAPAKVPAGVTGTWWSMDPAQRSSHRPKPAMGSLSRTAAAIATTPTTNLPGSGLGSIFNLSQGQITFYLKSRYSFAQRQASASAHRYAFDVRDGKGHLFTFLTQVASGSLEFEYAVGGSPQYYFVPKGTEDSLFGAGVTLKVTMTWNGNVSNLYLNDKLVKSTPYTAPASNWTTGSNFNVGAYEYLTYGGYNASDDVIDDFVVTSSQALFR